MSNVTPKLTGRIRILTDRTADELERTDVVLEELDRVLEIHWENVKSIRFLQNYFLGVHPAILNREKTQRPDVDNKIIVDYAFSFTRDITGYFLGKSVRYVHRDPTMTECDVPDPENVDEQAAAKACEDNCNTLRSAVEALNHIHDIEGKNQVDWDVATDMSICGVGYKGIFTDRFARNGTHLSLSHLNPENTFVVYSSGNVQTPMFAVSYWCNNVKSPATVKTYLTVYTQTKQFDFVVDADIITNGPLMSGNSFTKIGEENIYFNGSLPIIEYRNNQYGLGDWEVAIPLMDGIDTLASDGVNDIEQFVANVLIAIGMEFDAQTEETLNRVGVLNIPQLPPGMEFPPELRYITPHLDAASGEAMREYLESCLRIIVGVPDRKNRGGGGGDTGDAVFLRDGWQDIDLVAANKESWFVMSEREALNVTLYILGSYGEVSDVSQTDIEIKFNRNKTSNIQSKVQALSTLWGLLDPTDAMDIVDLTTNIQDVIMRAEKYQEKRLEKQLNEQERVSEVAAKFDKKNEDVNTGTQPKSDKSSDDKSK